MRLTISGFVLLTMALILTLAGCGGGGSDGAAKALVGRVVDAGSLQALSGVRIVGDGRETLTGADGVWTLSGVSSSLASLTVTGQGYTAQLVAVPAGSSSLDLGDTFLVPAPVSGYGNITGVTTLAGNAVGGAVITAGGRTATSRSDGANKGRYTLYNVPAGAVTVAATYTDPATSDTTGATFGLTVQSLTTATSNIRLTLQPPPPPINN